MKLTTFFRPPGVYIFIMTALWALPFAIYAIVQEPYEVKYHLFHLKFFTVPIFATIIFNKSSKITVIWAKNNLWSRISIVCGGYAFSSIITIILLISFGGGYYGGDGGGSYALLLFPSIAFYAVILLRRLNIQTMQHRRSSNG